MIWPLVVVEPVERIEEAFAGHLEDMVDALRDECVGQHASAVTQRGTGLAGLGQFHPVLLPLGRRLVGVAAAACRTR